MFGFLTKLKHHAAIACGDFEVLFEKADQLPPLPAASAKLIQEVSQAEPDSRRIEQLLGSTPETAAHLLRLVNSSYFGVRTKVKSIRQATALLGLRRLKQFIMGLGILKALPMPGTTLFNQEAFWTDTLLTALFARKLSHQFAPDIEETVFTSMLLTEIAVPVLLTQWSEYYEYILKLRRAQPGRRLSSIEREELGWDHGQAGAWLARKWQLPEEIASVIAAHVMDYDTLKAKGLQETPAVLFAASGHLPGVDTDLSTPETCDCHIALMEKTGGFNHQALRESLDDALENFNEFSTLFELNSPSPAPHFDLLLQRLQPK
jgi:HD-like signal output (HDOD) protein